MKSVQAKHGIRVMKRLRLFATLWGVAVATAVVPAALAHHSFAEFDDSKKTTLEGTLKAVRWENPHIGLDVDVPDGKGGTVEWKVSGPSPNDWRAEDWSKKDFNVGEKVKLVVHPRRDGAPAAALNIFWNSAGKQFGKEIY